MSLEQRREGIRWVTETLQELAGKAGVPATNIQWRQSDKDFDRGLESLVFGSGETEVVQKFSRESLEDCPADTSVQNDLRDQLELLINSLLSGEGELPQEQLVEDEAERDEEPEFHYSITSYGADYPVDGLVKRLKAGDIHIPPFQRQYVWRKPQASRFIESLLLGLPVPGIFLAREGQSHRLLVIDGQQRLRTLQRFYDGIFDKSSFDLTGVKRQFEGLTYNTLPEDDRRRLDDSILHATIVKQDHPSDRDSSVYLLFERLNTGGTLLHPQEIRACVYHGKFNELLARLNADSHWRNVYGPESPRMKDRELILRFFALRFDLDHYARPMVEALNQYMDSNRQLQNQDAATLEKAFRPTIKLIDDFIGASAFRPVRAINAAVYDAVMVGLANRMEREPSPDPERIRPAYDSLLKAEDFEAAYGKSTSDEEQVRKRIQIAISYFQKI
jgi:hypothetical protein